MNRIILTTAAAMSALMLVSGAAQAQSFAVGAHVGTTGLGAEAYYNVNPLVTVRVGGDYGTLDEDLSSDDINYAGDAEWKTFNVAVDLHPFSNPFFVSAGVYAGDRSVDVTAVSSRNITISGVPFSPAQLGTIVGKAEMSDTTPFIGIGYDNTFYREGAWGFRALAGVAISDDPKVKLHATGPFANDPLVLQYLREEEADLEDDASDFNTWPVLSVGVNYRF